MNKKNVTIKIKDGLAIISRPEVSDTAEYKAIYNRFAEKDRAGTLQVRAHKIVNKLQADIYNSRPSVLSRLMAFLYTPAPKLKKGKVLDVGCNTGDFLYYLPPQFEKTGLEVNVQASTFAASRGLRVHNTLFEKSALNEKFDLVRCSHVLEHIQDYKSFLTKASETMEKGGLMVIYTPNLNSFSRLVFRGAWEGYNDTTHFTIFSIKALKEIGKEYGFRVKQAKTYYMGYTAAGLTNLSYLTQPFLRSVLFTAVFILLYPIELILAKAGLGDAVYVELELAHENV